jgi:mono/diheme cytochrome c family protein
VSGRYALLATLLFGLAACEVSQPGPGFEQVIVPILDRHCVMCHMSEGAQGELSLYPQPHAALVGVASSQSDLLLVTPGDVEASYLYHKLLGSHLGAGGEGESMPYQRDLLEAEDIKAIEQWIAQGASAD